MPVVNPLDLLTVARREGFAVAAVNIVDALSAQAAVAAAETLRSPLVLQAEDRCARGLGSSRAAPRSLPRPAADHRGHRPRLEFGALRRLVPSL
jgi:fructose/tagatose bisphosphate aldolase